MPELHFKGKEFVLNHHLTIPYRPLVHHPDKSIGTDSSNLIIQGDNLHVLKALVPHYADRIDCIFIDPPYNTGNENWNYNDNVNTEMMKEWVSSNPVNGEDMLRHDKWCCMIYPRLKLLHELLSENGSLWMTIDDNELQHAKLILDEIFGENNFVETVIWQKNFSPKNTARHFSKDHDYLLVYAKNGSNWRPNLQPRTERMGKRYSNPDNDPRGPWSSSDMAARNPYSQGRYPVTTPAGRIIEGPPPGRYWIIKESKFHELNADDRIWWGEKGDNVPRIKRFLSDVQPGRVPQTLWSWREVGHTQDAKKEILRIMNSGPHDEVFVTPKPTRLIERALQLATGPESIVLDAFAGSATTGHAVLAQNVRDGGKRRFVLVEAEEYADSLTAERIRRVIRGYSYVGVQREVLLRESLTYSDLAKDSRRMKILSRIEAIENLDGTSYDEISKQISDGDLVITGEKTDTSGVSGLGGNFGYYTLGKPLDLDSILLGKALPDYETIGAWLFYTATGEALDLSKINESKWYLGESTGFYVWLVYKADLDFLKSRDASLTVSLAEVIAVKADKRHLVFAPARFAPNSILSPLGVDYAPLPYALYRLERSN